MRQSNLAGRGRSHQLDHMSDTGPQLEIAHVLFIDIVGYSKRLINEQRALIEKLTGLVRSTEQFRHADDAGKLISIPTGDGMALAFFTAPDAPVRCAIELSKADQDDPKIELRIGIHSGPVDRLGDVNQRTNIAGAGINMAQRVMECGDAGHILLSNRVGDDLAQYAQWRPYLHDLGEVEVKHGVRLGIVNFHSDAFGNQLAHFSIWTWIYEEGFFEDGELFRGSALTFFVELLHC